MSELLKKAFGTKVSKGSREKREREQMAEERANTSYAALNEPSTAPFVDIPMGPPQPEQEATPQLMDPKAAIRAFEDDRVPDFGRLSQSYGLPDIRDERGVLYPIVGAVLGTKNEAGGYIPASDVEDLAYTYSADKVVGCWIIEKLSKAYDGLELVPMSETADAIIGNILYFSQLAVEAGEMQCAAVNDRNAETECLALWRRGDIAFVKFLIDKGINVLDNSITDDRRIELSKEFRTAAQA